GLHMRGFPLEKQMIEHGAVYIRTAKTAANYKMVKLDVEPPKPGLNRTNKNGTSIEVELWEMPLSEFGFFTALIPAPLAMGKIKLEDGAEVTGFICEGAAAEGAKDI